MCEELDRAVDWQWNVNPWGKQDHPGTAVAYYLLYPDLVDEPTMRDRAFDWLVYGQRQDPAAQEAYRRCREHGDDHLFDTVLRAAGGRPADFPDAAVHLEWQIHSDPLSLVRADAAWRRFRSTGELRHRVEAGFALLSGQWHNANACQEYRACLDESAERLLADAVTLLDRLRAGDLVHPYLQGAVPSALNIRDEVPSG